MAEFSFWYTILVVAVMTLALAFELAKTEVVVFTALLALTLAGIVTVPEAFKGFSNEGMLSVGFLFIVAAALQVTGVLDSMTRIFFGKDRGSVAGKLIRFSFPVAGISAFLNNTPLVAMLTPLVKSWCKRNNFSPSKFLIPLSYVTILGGTCTLVGTSTNLVVQGLLIDYNLPRLSFFDLGIVALPTAILGILFISLFLSRLLPDHRESVAELGESTREFVVALKVGPEYAEIGKSVEAAGLRHLQGLFLFQIERNGDIIAPLEPTEKIQLNDRLFFTGLPGTIVELQRQPGLHVVQDAELDLKNYDSSELKTYEVVISESSPLVGRTVRGSNFRGTYDAVILAIHRNGERIMKKVGDIELRIGDTLLILAGKDFYTRWYHSKDFYLVSTTDEIPSRPRSKGVVTSVIAGAMILVVAFDIMPMLIASATAVAVLLLTRTISSREAIRGIEWETLLVIASAFGIAKALENSGVAQQIAHSLVSFATPYGPIALLATVYIIVMVYTEFITNNAAAALIFPIAISVAVQGSLPVTPFVFAVALAASNGFAMPMGYATHMMVQGAGGYSVKDFLRVGIPLDLFIAFIAITILSLIFF